MIFHQDIHLPFEDGPPTKRPLGRTFLKALLNTCLFNMAEHGQHWQLDGYVRGKTPECQKNVTAKLLPHMAVLLLPSKHRREDAILCTADSPTDFQPDPSYQSHRRADGQVFFTILLLKFPLKTKDLLRGHYALKYLHFILRAKAIAARSSRLQHHAPGFQTFKCARAFH